MERRVLFNLSLSVDIVHKNIWERYVTEEIFEIPNYTHWPNKIYNIEQKDTRNWDVSYGIFPPRDTMHLIGLKNKSRNIAGIKKTVDVRRHSIGVAFMSYKGWYFNLILSFFIIWELIIVYVKTHEPKKSSTRPKY